jgi:hypothetical protein
MEECLNYAPTVCHQFKVASPLTIGAMGDDSQNLTAVGRSEGGLAR